MGKVIVISGASAGIGKTAMQMLEKKGHTVYNLSRRPTPGNHIKTDVTSPEDIKNAIKQIYDKEGRIDALINNAGMGISGAIENTDLANAKRMFDVNFFGAFNLIREVLPYMRKSGGGTIVNISSAAAKFPLPFQAFYSASKSALCSLSDALRLEVAPFNIKVVSALPGDVKTEFTEKRVKNSHDDSVYGDRVAKSVAIMERDEMNGMPPEVIGRIIVKLINSKNPPPFVMGGKQYAFLNFLAKILPYRFVMYLIGKIYG
ncbi:MAG: SDR family oxidoreductase [Christensenellales bacterium]|jgi:short-subunit dehydrogenase|nr:SDR family oxidoreductase [Clostridiales bacterium]